MQGDFVAIFCVGTIIGLPILLGFAMAGYSMVLRQKQLEMMLKERELLIEKGVADLPPLMLPGAAEQKKGNGHGNLKWGLILLFLAGGLAISHIIAGGHPIVGNVQLQATIVLAALGLALLTIHYTVRRYERNGQG